MQETQRQADLIDVAPEAPTDPYQLRPEAVAEPPQTLLDTLRRIGPGMILAASIVGSGELIATTTLGAQVGYTALWVILLSCLIKPVVQAEMGRYIIATGETGLASFNRVPGPRLGVGWVVWAWAIMTFMTLLQVGAMFGGVAQVMNLLFPSISILWWVLIFLILTLALLLGGGYDRIEKLAMIKVGLFTLLTLLAAVIVTRRPEFSWGEFAGGLTFKLPGEGLATAVAVFGITGVGASELFMYPYWCVEKGYAQFAGRNDGSPQWIKRAEGWIRVMHTDIIASMIVYTVATIAFYLLGAGVLHGMGRVPVAADMIPVLSNIYTRTLGEWSLWLFYLGAVAILYGTIFAATAANSRVFADLCRLLGMFAPDDYPRRLRFRRAWVIILAVVPAFLYWAIASPVKMVVAGGLAQALMLPIIGLSTLYLRHRHLPREAAPSRAVTIALWGAVAVIVLLMGYYALEQLRRLS
jgi:Mn2+/Fe2+ NRAMP family transporter